MLHDRVDGTVGGTVRVSGRLAAARRQLADAVRTLGAGTPDPVDVAAVIAGTHELTTLLARLVEATTEHVGVLAGRHGRAVSAEIRADLRALHDRLTTGTLLLVPALEDLGMPATASSEDIVTNMDKPWNDVADQLRPAQPDVDLLDDEEAADASQEDPADVVEADPADVADQRRVVPLPDEPAGDELP